jgi:hypothetical protein
VPLVDPYTLMDMLGDLFADCRPSYDGLSGLKALVAGIRMLGCDVMLRHAPVTAPNPGSAIHMQNIAPFDLPIVTTGERRGELWVETMVTPLGTLTGVWGFTGYGSWIPHPVRYPVITREDLKIYHYAVSHLSVSPPALDTSVYLELDREIGEDGIATASLPTSPLMY